MVEVEGLTKRFGKTLAVDDLSFRVRPGAVTGFLGPNGAGKTTTLRILLGLVHPTSGSATVLGRRFRDLDAPARRVGAVVETAGFHPGRSGRDHLRALPCDHGGAMSETAAHAPPTLEELRARSREILQLAEAHGARNVAVFGSVARGRADGRSDVDFLVDMDPGRGLFDMGSLLMDLQDLLGCEVDVVTRKGLRERIRDRVLAEVKPV